MRAVAVIAAFFVLVPFVQHMARFVQTHRRTKLIAYFNAKPGSIFDLASKPRSLAAYKRFIVPLGR